MTSQLLVLILAAAVGQAPSDGKWLDSVPAEADVVIRVRGVDAVSKDIVAMLKAMSPALAAQAEPALEMQVAKFRTQFGEQAATQPFLTLIRGVPPEDPGSPPFAIVVRATNYEEVLKSASGGKDPKIKKDPAGFDSYDGPEGKTWYAAKGAGTVVFGPDKALIAGYVKPTGGPTRKPIAPALRARFDSGDVGIYVNVNSLVGRYGKQIAQAKQGILGAVDQAGQQMGNAAIMDMVKKFYAGAFDSLNQGDGIVLSLDFSAEGLGLDGNLKVKDDSDAARAIATSKPGDSSTLGRLPADASYFAYMNIDSKTFNAMQAFGLNMIAPDAKPSPERDAVKGPIETIGSSSIGTSMRSFNVMTTSEPKLLLAASEAALRAMKAGNKAGDSPLNFFKDVTVTPNAETYSGFTFTRVDMTLDLDKLAKTQPGNPNAGKAMAAMFGGDHIANWYGINDKQMIQVGAPNWAEAKAQIDAYLKGGNTLGSSAGFKATRAKLPEQANLIMLISVQGFVRQMATQLSATFGNPNLKAPADMPKEPVLVGGSLSSVTPAGFEFHLFVPGAAGPVIEKGLVPVFQNLRPQ